MPMMDRDEFEQLIVQIARDPAPESHRHTLMAIAGITGAEGSRAVPPAGSGPGVNEERVRDDQTHGHITETADSLGPAVQAVKAEM